MRIVALMGKTEVGWVLPQSSQENRSGNSKVIGDRPCFNLKGRINYMGVQDCLIRG